MRQEHIALIEKYVTYKRTCIKPNFIMEKINWFLCNIFLWNSNTESFVITLGRCYITRSAHKSVLCICNNNIVEQLSPMYYNWVVCLIWTFHFNKHFCIISSGKWGVLAHVWYLLFSNWILLFFCLRFYCFRNNCMEILGGNVYEEEKMRSWCISLRNNLRRCSFEKWIIRMKDGWTGLKFGP